MQEELQRARDLAKQMKAEQGGFVPFGEGQEARLLLAGEKPEAKDTTEPSAAELQRARELAQQMHRETTPAYQLGRGEQLQNLLHSEAINFLNDLSSEAQQTVAEFGTGLANLAIRGGHSLGTLSGIHELELPQLDRNVKSPAAKLVGSLLGTLFLPPIPGFGATRAAGRIAQAAAQAGIAGGIFGAARGEPGRGALMGAALGAPLAGALEGAHLPFALTKMAIGKARSIPEIQSIMNRLGDVHASIGDISNSIGLKRLYNTVLRHVPFSGVAKQSENLLEKTQGIANDIHSHLTGDIPEEEIPSEIISALKENTEKQENIKRQLYHRANEEAVRDNFKLEEPTNLKETAKRILKEEAQVTEDPMNDAQLNVFKRAATGLQEPGLNETALMLPNGETLQIEGNAAEKIADFNHAIAAHSAYGKRAAEAADAGKMRIAKAYTQAREALEDDIVNQAEKMGNPLVKRYWENARKHFRENVVPNRKKFMRDLIHREGKGFENIEKQLFKKENQKILEQLPQRTKRLLASKALGRVTRLNEQTGQFETAPDSLINAYQKLTGDLAKDSTLRNRLFNPEDQEWFKDLDAFVKASAEPRLQAQARPTGMRTISELLHTAAPIAGVAALASGNVGALAKSLLGIAGGGRAVASLLASPKYRQQILRGRAFEETPFLLQQTLQRLAALFARQRTTGQRGQR